MTKLCQKQKMVSEENMQRLKQSPIFAILLS